MQNWLSKSNKYVHVTKNSLMSLDLQQQRKGVQIVERGFEGLGGGGSNYKGKCYTTNDAPTGASFFVQVWF